MIRVLQLEDDPDITEICQMALGMTGGFELLQCSSGHEALEKAEAFAPDLFLIDVMLPGMSGPDTLARLKTLPGLADIPAIYFTARLQKDEVGTFLAQGAAKVIAKPFDPMTLGDELIEVYNRS